MLLTRAEYEEAQRQYERAIAFSRDACDRIYEGIWNGGLGNLYSSLWQSSGNPIHRESAVSYYVKAIAIAKETTDRRHESHWNGVLGIFFWKLGEVELAEAHLRDALTISEKIHYGRMIQTQIQWLATVFDDRIRRHLESRDLEAAFHAGRSFRRVASEIGSAGLEAEAERRLDELPLNEIVFLFEEGRMDEAIAKGREFLASSAAKAKMCSALGAIGVRWGRRTGDEGVFESAVEAYSKAIAMTPDDSRYGLYEERANANALLGRLEDAIADYSEVIKREPQNTGASFSRAEVQIWAGRYGEARLSLETLHPQLRTRAEKTTGAWLMCHALNLEGRDFLAYQKVLEEGTKENTGLNYHVRDIEPYLRRLDQKKFSVTQILNAWMIQSLIVKLATLASKP